MTPYGHGRNPNHVREQGQRKWHFWISMVSAMSFFSETVRCRDMAREYRIESWNRRVTKKNFMKFWHRAAEIWDLEDGQNCNFPSLISQQPCVRTSWIFFWWLSYNTSQFPFYGSYPGTSPNLRKRTWLKPWKLKIGPFSGLNLGNGWDFKLGPWRHIELLGYYWSALQVWWTSN